MKKFLKWFGIILGLLIVVVFALSLFVVTFIMPSDRVLIGDQIPDRYIKVLRTEEILEDGELVELFYSEGLLSIKEGGSILTNRRVIAYEEAENKQIDLYEINIEEISSVEQTQQGDVTNYSIYKVNTHDEDWLELWLPHEHGDGERFANAVRGKIKNTRPSTATSIP